VTSAAIRFDGATSSIAVATGFGPRIVGLFVNDRNLLAELPDDVLEGPAGRPYRLRGGHRLWAAPEIPEVTYQPDDVPCTLARRDDGIHVEAPQDGAGLAKAITIAGTQDGWIVDHTITNQGRIAVRVAPWAITQFRLGGRITLGLAGTSDGLQADRALVLWPYTDPTDGRLSLGNDGVTVEASPGPTLKVGVAGGVGTATYELEGTRVGKRISVRQEAHYPDLGAAVQAYVCDRFCEVETLGPISVLAPGGTVTHREEWTIS
jgi:hypothetical protein